MLYLNFSTSMTFMDRCPARPPDLGFVPEISNTLMRGMRELEWAGSGCLAEGWRIRLLGTNPAFLNPLSVCCHVVVLPFALLGLFQRFGSHCTTLSTKAYSAWYAPLYSFFFLKIFFVLGWTCFSWNIFHQQSGLIFNLVFWGKMDPFLINQIV